MLLSGINIIKFSLVFAIGIYLLIGPLTGVSVIEARNLDEVQSELAEKQKQLEKTQQELAEAESKLSQTRSRRGEVLSDVETLEAEIDEVEAEINFRTLQLEQLEEQKLLNELAQEENIKLQDLQVDEAYLSWKSGSAVSGMFGGADIVKRAVYNEVLYTRTHGGILGLAERGTSIEQDLAEFGSSREELQLELEELAEQVSIARARLQEVQAEVSMASANFSSANRAAGKIQSEISFLSQEEQELIRRQQQIYNETGSSNISETELVDGEFYLEGRGSNFVTGHGIGMSQWGAYGAAINRGWDYKQIVEFYFPGAKVVKRSDLVPESVNVSGHGSMPMDTYLAGLGEVADKACEDLGVPYQSSVCWPREAILAQMVVARNFAALRSGGIGTTDSDQVYKGGTAKLWAAEATKDEVVVWNGQLADVYYSADNNEGHGTADKETIWGGARIPYLTSVNDNSFAAKPHWGPCGGWCGDWTWRTYSYSSDDMLGFAQWSRDNAYSGAMRDAFTAIANVGEIEAIVLAKDPSRRVNRVTFRGSNGEASVSGRNFRAYWNLWNGTRPSGERDLIYSFTFDAKQR